MGRGRNGHVVEVGGSRGKVGDARTRQLLCSVGRRMVAADGPVRAHGGLCWTPGAPRSRAPMFCLTQVRRTCPANLRHKGELGWCEVRDVWAALEPRLVQRILQHQLPHESHCIRPATDPEKKTHTKN